MSDFYNKFWEAARLLRFNLDDYQTIVGYVGRLPSHIQTEMQANYRNDPANRNKAASDPDYYTLEEAYRAACYAETQIVGGQVNKYYEEKRDGSNNQRSKLENKIPYEI